MATLYHPTTGQAHQVPDIDAPAWISIHGYRTEPAPATEPRTIAPTAAPVPPAPAPVDLGPAVARLAELQAIYEAEGWRAINAIADPLGVIRHEDGWDSSLLRIIESEFSVEIAAALA